MTFHSIETGGIATRRLRYALAASLLLHLLLLWPGAPRVSTAAAPAVLHAALRAPVAPVPPPSRAVPPAPTPAPTRFEPQVLEQTRPRFVPLAAPATAEIPPAPIAAAAPAAAPAPGSGAPVVAGTGNRAAEGEAGAVGEVLDGLRGYRLAVASQARRFKRYPAQAMASGWVGSAEIRLEVAGDGQPRAAAVIRSSGHELLDQAALTMIEAGAQRARLPESLRGKSFAVVLPVMFDLAEE